MNTIRSNIFVPFFAVVFLTAAPLAFADDISDASRATDQLTGQAEEFRKLNEPQITPNTEQPSITDQAESIGATGETAGPRFLVTKILFEGNTVFSASDLAPYTTPHENQTVSLDTLKLVANAVTDHYRSRGYVNSRAYLKPQKIQDGVVTVTVIEAKLGKTIVEGNKYFSAELFEEALDIPRDHPFRYSELENRLRFLSRNPDFRAAAFLKPGEQPETSDLYLKVDDKLPLHVYYEFNNHGTKLTHRSRHTVTGIHNNFLGRSDTFSVSAAMAEQGAFDAYSAGWSIPIWKTGTTFQLSGSYVDSLLVKHLKASEITGLSWSVTPAIVQELVATPTQQGAFYTGLEIKDSKTSVNDLKSDMDRMRVLVAGPRWTFLDPMGRTSLSADLHWGIPGLLGGSEANDLDATRTHSGGDFIYYTGSAARLQKLPAGCVWLVRGSGQWSDTELTSLEQMRLGGYSSVRGYPESDSSGDYGFVGVNELSVPMPVSDSVRVPFTNDRVNQTVRWVGFFDAGKAFEYHRSSRAEQKDRMLMGVGLGVRINLSKHFSAQFDYAWPLGDDATDQAEAGQPQATFSIRSGF